MVCVFLLLHKYRRTKLKRSQSAPREESAEITTSTTTGPGMIPSPPSGHNSETPTVVQGFYLTHPPPVIPDYQTPRRREISDYLEPVNSGPYEEIDESLVRSTSHGASPADQRARYANVADAKKTYENAGFIPDTSSGIYEDTPGGGYEKLQSSV